MEELVEDLGSQQHPVDCGRDVGEKQAQWQEGLSASQAHDSCFSHSSSNPSRSLAVVQWIQSLLIADCFVLSQFQHGQHRQVSNSRGSQCSKTRANERHEAIGCVRVQLYAGSCFRYFICSAANIPEISSLPPIAIAVHHHNSLDINDKLLPSIAMTQRTILNFQVARTDKNISMRLRIEVSALSSHSCVSINDGEAKASALKPNCCHHQIVVLCPSPASPS